MFGSKNYFFKQGKDVLAIKRNQLQFILSDVWDRSDEVVSFYLKAYDFFVASPDDFDGATIVKDLKIMPELDIHAMIHDYIYLTYNVSSDVIAKFNADLIYAHEMEKMGGSAYATWSRFAGLSTFGLLFLAFKKITGHKMSSSDKIEFGKVCVTFEEKGKLFND